MADRSSCYSITSDICVYIRRYVVTRVKKTVLVIWSAWFVSVRTVIKLDIVG